MSKMIALDAGHGGKDSGAVNKDLDIMEKDVVLDITVNKIKPILEHWGYEVFLTRDKDEFYELYERVEMIDNSNSVISVSVHNNAVYNKEVTGSEVYHYPGSVGKNLAEKIQNNFVRYLDNNDRDIKENDSFALVKGPHVPAVICEPVFISSNKEGEKLSNEWYRFLIAYSISDGIRRFFEEGYMSE